MTETAPASIPAFLPPDGKARAAISENLDETLFVEASAGTGKTSSLVARIVNLVTTGRTTLDRIAAITFTEAAASELRDRIRQQLERASEDPDRGEVQRSRCRQGVSDIDHAAIRTLHSFAALLLHERPLEAGLPPAFETTDAIAAGLRFEEAWNAWLDVHLDENSALAPHLELAFTLGMNLAHLRGAAREFHENYADLLDVEFDKVAQPSLEAAGLLAQAASELETLCQYSKLRESDYLFNHVQGKLVAMRRLERTDPREPDAFRLMRRLVPFKCGRGRQGDWNVDPQSGRNACTAVKSVLSDLESGVSEELEEVRRAVLSQILQALQQFAIDYAKQRRAEGRAEFNDLLVWARELLRDNLEVRDHFQRRFSHLLIDEAQDTDPIQAEIAMFLAEGATTAGANAALAISWTAIHPESGKLFVVGDPKQSIYRFRRADVVQMRTLRQLMEQGGGRTVSLVQNFRSHQPIIDWVNHLFGQWMGVVDPHDTEEYVQAKYENLLPRWTVKEGDSVGPSVWTLADEATPGTAEEIRQQESRDIASLLSQIVDQEWQVLNREVADKTGEAAYKKATYSDICILMPARTSLRTLERGLEASNVPYRLESASLVFDTQEVRDLLNCLRAIDNPADHVATVAALRSVAFGCSDGDLLQHFEACGTFDYMRDSAVGAAGPVGKALQTLRDFHDKRMWESVGTLIDRFLRDRQLMESSVGHPRMREQWRRYRFIIEQAWQFAASGGNSLRAFVNWLEDQMSQNARVTEAPVPESDEDAVRIMTVHASKGLEFPIVILTGLNAESRHRSDIILLDRGRRRVEVAIGNRKGLFSTKGHSELDDREKRMSEAEHVRLMYVAATRARDHLVVSLRRREARNDNTTAGAISSIIASAPDMSREISLAARARPAEPAPVESSLNQEAEFEEHSLRARDQWEESRQKLLANRGVPVAATATSLGHNSREDEDKPEQETPEPWRKGRAGTSVGRAVHAVLQSVDLSDGTEIEDRARAQAVAEGVQDRTADIVRLSRAALDSEVVRRAVASGRYWREVPVAVPVADGFLHGFLDLLFEENDGLVVVDYKTDSVSGTQAAEATSRYRLQGGAYAHAIQEITGRQVKEVVFLYLQPEREERLPDLEQAMQDALVEAEGILTASG